MASPDGHVIRSPLKLHNLLCSASTAPTYDDCNYDTDPMVGSRTKFSFFQGETTGEDVCKEETKLLTSLEEEQEPEPLEDGEEEAYVDEDMNEKLGCLPRRLLLLAREESD
jgi:hypothetical protein